MWSPTCKPPQPWQQVEAGIESWWRDVMVTWLQSLIGSSTCRADLNPCVCLSTGHPIIFAVMLTCVVGKAHRLCRSVWRVDRTRTKSNVLAGCQRKYSIIVFFISCELSPFCTLPQLQFYFGWFCPEPVARVVNTLLLQKRYRFRPRAASDFIPRSSLRSCSRFNDVFSTWMNVVKPWGHVDDRWGLNCHLLEMFSLV